LVLAAQTPTVVEGLFRVLLSSSGVGLVICKEVVMGMRNTDVGLDTQYGWGCSYLSA
jgi:hypothetical protein